MTYAWTCAAYLVGAAGSILQAAELSEETLAQARENLRAEFEVFESDHVGWAGYLMEGSRADRRGRQSEGEPGRSGEGQGSGGAGQWGEEESGDEEDAAGGRGRLFVREGREIVRAVEWARGAVEEVVGL